MVLYKLMKRSQPLIKKNRWWRHEEIYIATSVPEHIEVIVHDQGSFPGDYDSNDKDPCLQTAN